MENIDVLIIGGGWSGLVTCKYMLKENFKVIILEKRSGIGGVWSYTDDPSIPSVMKNTVTTSSKTITEISDFPMPDDFPHFPHHSLVYSYLKDFCNKYELWKYIRFNRSVTRVKKENGLWIIEDSDGQSYSSKYLCICTGAHEVADKSVLNTKFKDFKGKTLHSIEYKKVLPEFIGKNILIYGGGETGSDIANELSYVAQVYFSIPHGQWFQNKVAQDGDPYDHYSSRLRRFGSPINLGCPLLVKTITNTYGFQAHGIEEWRSPAEYYGQFFNKSPEVLKRIRDGFVIPLPDVETIESDMITFLNKKQFQIDYIILCTGFYSALSFLPCEYTHVPNQRFKLIFDPKDPTLAFIGLIRPTVTSIPGMTEMQIRLVTEVFTNRIKLPDEKQMQIMIEQDQNFLQQKYGKTSKRINGLVDPEWYQNSISSFGKFQPNYWKLFFQNPYFWYIAITAPCHGSQFMLNDKKNHPYVLSVYKKLRPKPFSRRFILDNMGGWLIVRIVEGWMRFRKKYFTSNNKMPKRSI